MDKPQLFISHKHADTDIATVVAKFIRDRSLGNVEVFLSSNWTFQGPRFGAGLNNELVQKLWHTDALLLIYTAADQDWSYCMWECGVATDRNSPETRIVVFQCGRDVPTPFANDLRVDIRNPGHIKRFTKQFLTEPNFFPKRGIPVAPDVVEETIEKAAEELFTNLKPVIPSLPDLEVDEWAAWPFLRIELPQADVEKLRNASAAERVKLAHEIVKEKAIVTKSDMRAPQLFGLAGIPEKFKFQELLRVWKDNYPNSDPTWFESCCEQIMVSARREFPIIRWTHLREVDGEADFTPVLSRIKSLPFANKVHFDIFFYNMSDPRAIPAYSKMIATENFFYKKVNRENLESIKLVELLNTLNQKGLNRIPFFTETGHPLFIIHRSMIDKFLVQKLVSGNGNLNDVTLAELLANDEMKKIFENSFVIISKQSSLAEAKSAMVARPDCSDVFITEHGIKDEPVQGWLTNVDIARNN